MEVISIEVKFNTSYNILSLIVFLLINVLETISISQYFIYPSLPHEINPSEFFLLYKQFIGPLWA